MKIPLAQCCCNTGGSGGAMHPRNKITKFWEAREKFPTRGSGEVHEQPRFDFLVENGCLNTADRPTYLVEQIAA